MLKLNRALLLLLWLSLVFIGQAWAQTAPNWTSVGPPGGTLTSLLADPNAPAQRLYAGSDFNGVFGSFDGGSTWNAVNTNLPADSTGTRHVYAMAASTTNIYVVTDSGLYTSPLGPNKSAISWSKLSLPGSGSLPVCSVSNGPYVLMTVSSNTLYLASVCETTVHAMALSGSSWVDIVIPGTVDTATSLSAVSGGFLGVGTAGGFLYWLDANTGTLVSSERDVTTPALVGGINSVVRGAVGGLNSTSIFLCNSAGAVFQADMPSVLSNTVWNEIPTAYNLAAGPSCQGLALVAVNNSPNWVLAVASGSGIYLSQVIDNSGFFGTGGMVPSINAGPALGMTTNVNAVLQANSVSLSPLLVATDFGLYSTAVANLASGSAAPLTGMNGATVISTASPRLNNVNVKDVAVIGSMTYVIAEAQNGTTYVDVLVSADAGATWQRTTLTSLIGSDGINSLVADQSNQVLYARTDHGIYYKTSAGSAAASAWTAHITGVAYSVTALAAGAQLYVGRDDTFPLVTYALNPSGVPSVTSTTVAAITSTFDVTALEVRSGTVYAGLGIQVSSTPTYAISVYSASEAAPTSWTAVGGGSIPTASPFLAEIKAFEIVSGQLFVGGDGFLRQCALASCTWSSSNVSWLPAKSSGSSEMATVTGLSTDGSLLYVGTAGAGLLAFNVAAGTSALYNGNAPRDLPSSYINSTRVFGTQLFVASAAGLARPAVCGDDNSCGTTPTSPGGTLTGGTGSANPVTWSGGGGCSIGSVDEPDPVLWALVALALLQLGLGRLRQRRQALRLVPAQVRSDSARGLRP